MNFILSISLFASCFCFDACSQKSAVTKTANADEMVFENITSNISFADKGYDAPKSYPNYKLVWADEFNGKKLDEKSWLFENGDGCPNLCGWGNNEMQYYKPENTIFKNGKMIIEAKKEDFGNKNFTSSKIVTRGKKAFKYGRVDFRAILPNSPGIWPAFWMLPEKNIFGGWPQSGEIDIMEVIGKEPSKLYGTLHFGPGPGSVQLGSNVSLQKGSFNDEFHVFSLEWEENQLKWYLDGKLFSSYSIKDFGKNNYPFNEDFFFIINLAVGGNWPGSPDTINFKNQQFVIDYIRVYQKN